MENKDVNMSFNEDVDNLDEVDNLEIYDENIKKANKIKLSERFKKATAVVLAIGIGVASGLGITKLMKKSHKNEVKEDPNSTIEENNENNDTETLLTEQEIKNMNFDALLNHLDEGVQKDTFTLLNEVQNDFNNVKAPSIKLESDGEKQLYLNAKEMIALHVMANSDTYTEQTLASIYGNLLTATDVSTNYTQAARVMYTYYSRAKEESGIAKLFTSESNQKLVTSFEKIIVAYNKAEDKEAKNKVGKELINYFTELTDISKLDNAKETNAEAVSYILTTGLPWAYSNGIISQHFYNDLVEQNETVTCDNLYQQVASAEKYAISNKLANELILSEMPRALDEKNVKVTDRNIEIKFDAITKTTTTNNTTRKPSNSTTSSTTTEVKEVTREEAVKDFGEDKVKEAEDKALEEIEEENRRKEQEANEYRNGYNTGYEKAYIPAADTGVKISTETEGTESYKKGYALGVENGYTDGMIEYDAKLKALENNKGNSESGNDDSTPEIDDDNRGGIPTPITPVIPVEGNKVSPVTKTLNITKVRVRK